MFSFISSQLLFYISIIIILFIPGYFLLLAVFGKSENKISKLERFVFSFGFSLIIVNFIAFAFSKLEITITARNSILGVVAFCAVCFWIYKARNKNKVSALEVAGGNDLFVFSKNQIALIFIFLFLTLFIKTAYLTGTVAPTSTDMGHHLYWTKQMTETHKLPNYEGMPDFIIGEHIALGEIAMISSADFFGAFPVVFLLLINILGILTVFILTLRIFENKNIAILSLLFLGVLFAITSPQAKFVSGGVMGNILGNFLMPLCLYFYFRAGERIFSNPLRPLAGEGGSTKVGPDEEKNADSKKFLSLAVFATFGLFYTHHLTAFIFLFVSVLFIILYLLINYQEISTILKKVFKIIFSWPVMLTFITGLIFFFFIFTPNYMQASAVETAVGTPSKSTRVGLSLNNLKSSVGEARLALGFVGFLLLALAYKRKNFGFAIITSWTTMLFIMSTKPNWLLIDLPSSRIGNYMSYPLAILSAYGFYRIFKPDFSNLRKINVSNAGNIILDKFIPVIFLSLFVFTVAGGLLDNAQAFKQSYDLTPLIQTFSASDYLKNNINEKDVVLKDHNYITGDSWIKLFFMQGYKYPQSRGYFKRYEDPINPREMCTLYMISNPASAGAQECFTETKTNYLMINPAYDSSQFRKLKNFDAIYNNGGVAIYYKNN